MRSVGAKERIGKQKRLWRKELRFCLLQVADFFHLRHQERSRMKVARGGDIAAIALGRFLKGRFIILIRLREPGERK